jgi:hypothetical protein
MRIDNTSRVRDMARKAPFIYLRVWHSRVDLGTKVTGRRSPDRGDGEHDSDRPLELGKVLFPEFALVTYLHGAAAFFRLT